MIATFPSAGKPRASQSRECRKPQLAIRGNPRCALGRTRRAGASRAAPTAPWAAEPRLRSLDVRVASDSQVDAWQSTARDADASGTPRPRENAVWHDHRRPGPHLGKAFERRLPGPVHRDPRSAGCAREGRDAQRHRLRGTHRLAPPHRARAAHAAPSRTASARRSRLRRRLCCRLYRDDVQLHLVFRARRGHLVVDGVPVQPERLLDGGLPHARSRRGRRRRAGRGRQSRPGRARAPSGPSAHTPASEESV